MQAQQEQAAQQQAYQEQLLQLQLMIEERKADNEDAKVIEDQRQFDAELEFKYWAEGVKNELDEAKIATDTAIKMVQSERKTEQSSADTGKSASRAVNG